MVDFSKFRMPAERLLVTYRCERCGIEEEYLLELSGDMLVHRPIAGRCYGRLAEVSRRTEPRHRDGSQGVQAPLRKDEQMSNAQRPAGMTLAEFMGHSNRGGGKRNYLSGWRDKDPYSVKVWLHTQASIYTLWRHGFNKCEPREDKQTKAKSVEVWQEKLVCYETEDVLSKLYWRDRGTGQREVPPEVCPHCKLIEDVYQRCTVGGDVVADMVRRLGKKEKDLPWDDLLKAVHAAGGLYWLEPLFRFEGIVKGKGGAVVGDHKILHAGGLFNAYGSKNLTPSDKAAMAGVGKDRGGPIYASQAWMENNLPKLEYVYSVVNHDEVGKGVQISIEANLLGDKMKGEIGKEMKRRGAEAGNPLLKPYAFQWDYDPSDGIEFNKKYDVTALTEVRITPAIEKLIRATPPPDVGPLLARFNLKTHRARLEKHALVQLPWDAYFAEALKREAAKKAEEAKNPPEQQRAPDVGRDLPPAPQQYRDPGPAPAAPPPVAEVEEFSCDTAGCDAVLLATDAECPKCHAKYEVVGAPPPPPPPVRPKRSEARAAAQQRAGANAPSGSGGGGGSLGAMAPPVTDPGYGEVPLAGDPSDDIPF